MRAAAAVSLAASAVLGLGALFVARAVLPKAGSQTVAVAPQTGVPVVVAKSAIKYGQKLEPALLSVERVPRGVLPEGAFTNVDQVLSRDAGGPPVALVAIAAREPLLPAKLSGPGARPTIAAEIEKGMRAYTIKVTDVSGVGGHALPGDRVDVVLTRDLTRGDGPPNMVSNVVLQNVRVLGIDLNANLQSDKPASPNTATLEVSVSDAQKLSLAASLGSLSLALRRTGQAEIDDARALAPGDFLGGVQRAAPRAHGRTAAPAAEPKILIEVAGSGRSAPRRQRSAQTDAAAATPPGPKADSLAPIVPKPLAGAA